MTTQKAAKRDVRTRMSKTGERYTAAKARLDRKVEVREPWVTTDLGVSDERVAAATGRGWDAWIGELDRWSARDHTHAEIAKHLATSYGVTGWWAQTVTIGYERARGLRAVHQRTSGFTASASKTVATPAADLYATVADGRRRARWLEKGHGLKVRSATDGKAVRFDASDGTRVEARVTPKGAGKSHVAIQHERLPDAAAVAAAKDLWKIRLAALAAALE